MESREQQGYQRLEGQMDQKPPTFMPTQPRRTPTPLHVDVLIDASTNTWNTNMLTDMLKIYQ